MPKASKKSKKKAAAVAKKPEGKKKMAGAASSTEEAARAAVAKSKKAIAAATLATAALEAGIVGYATAREARAASSTEVADHNGGKAKKKGWFGKKDQYGKDRCIKCGHASRIEYNGWCYMHRNDGASDNDDDDDDEVVATATTAVATAADTKASTPEEAKAAAVVSGDDEDDWLPANAGKVGEHNEIIDWASAAQASPFGAKVIAMINTGTAREIKEFVEALECGHDDDYIRKEDVHEYVEGMGGHSHICEGHAACDEYDD